MNTKPLYLVIAAVLAVGAWLFRYEAVHVNDNTIFYRLDRWTGAVALVAPDFIRKLEYEKPEPPQGEGWWSKDPLAK